MTGLDDLTALAGADPSDALGTVERTAEQWAEAVLRARAVEELPVRHGIANIVFAGMGGSGIAGDVAAAVCAPVGTVPVAVVKGYSLPAYVGPNTLVICASYSGNTEETLACFDEAVGRKARIVVLTTGGRLAEQAAEHGVPRLTPIEGLQPRAALASLVVPTLVVLERLEILPDLSVDLADAEGVLAGRAKALGREVPEVDNEAKTIASQLEGMLPIVWGQDGVLATAAVRWRCQLNENAKVPAYSAILPELDHNDLVGYDPGVRALNHVALVVLRGPGEHPRVTLRVEATLEQIRGHVNRIIEAWGTGDTALARLMSAVMLGDFVSVYLALLRGIDPTPVDVITTLKNRLA